MINNLSKLIRKGEFDLDQEYETGINTYKRNLQSIIDIAKARGTKIILVTYAHYLYEDIKQSKLHKRYSEIVKAENKVIRNLATYNNLIMIDNEKKCQKMKNILLIVFIIQLME